jgi:hypothetical protein
VNKILVLVKNSGARNGLNLIGAISAELYNAAVAPHLQTAAIDAGARCIVVIGNGGGDFWRAYRRHVENQPEWERREDPLDDFTRDVVEREIAPAMRARGLRCTVVYPFTNTAGNLHFMELGRLAGIGGPSLLGVLIHPMYGTWIALRAALLIDQMLEGPGEGLGFDPCPRCVSRACMPACPVSAVSEQGWDVIKCLKHRVEAAPDCGQGCYSRLRCVIGPQHRYPDDEIRHHQERALRSMREYYRKTFSE